MATAKKKLTATEKKLAAAKVDRAKRAARSKKNRNENLDADIKSGTTTIVPGGTKAQQRAKHDAREKLKDKRRRAETTRKRKASAAKAKPTKKKGK